MENSLSIYSDDINYNKDISNDSKEEIIYDDNFNDEINESNDINNKLEIIKKENKKETKYRCISCSRIVEDVLILSCKHLLCLLCSSLQLKEKYEKYLKICKLEKQKNVRNYDINECFGNLNNEEEEDDNEKKEEIYKREKLRYINCNVCNIKNKITLETIEILTKIGLVSSDVLNVHNIINPNKITTKNNSNIENDTLFNTASSFNDTFNTNKNNIKKKLHSSNAYNYLDENVDDLNNYSYVCNICSFNEAIIYCNDCVEYLCKECCDNIHESELYKKCNLNYNDKHEYYTIDKNVIHLKKLVKAPKKICKIKEKEKSLYNSDEYSENDDLMFGDKKHKVNDNDSDFDKYDEEYFNERMNKFKEKEDKNKENIEMSEKINILVENMKNNSDYDSNLSSLKGSDGSTGFERKGDFLKFKNKKKKKQKKIINKISQNKNDVYQLATSDRLSILSCDTNDTFLNESENEIGITNIKKILSKKNTMEDENSNNNGISNRDFTYIQNIRCPQHFNYPIQYFCHTCCCPCFCSECAINGIHNNCDIENINSAFITILNKYLIRWNEIISDLKNDLERNFYELLEDTKNEWSSMLSECYCELNAKINYIINNLNKKELDIYETFDKYLENFKNENLEYVDLLSDKYKQIQDTITIIRNNKFETNPIKIIKFYRNNINDINEILLINNDIRSIEKLTQIRESKIFYMDFYSSQIIAFMRYLQTLTLENNVNI